MNRLVKAVGWGLASGVLSIVLFYAMLVLYAFEGFVVIGLPLGYAVTAVVAAWYCAENDHNFGVWTVCVAVFLGAMAGASVVLTVATILGFTALLRPPYIAGLLFLTALVAVARFVWTRPRPYTGP
jgi:hypothetical protein